MIKDLNFSVEDFVTEVLVRAGGLVEKPAYGLAEVLLPDTLEPLFTTNYLLLAFDYEVAAETPGSLFITHGSPLLDTIVSLALEYGRYTALYWPGSASNPPRSLDQKIKEAVNYLHCRPPRIKSHRTAENVFYGFYFRCIFRSYERREEVLSVVVDGCSGLPCSDFEKDWEKVVPAESLEYDLPQAPLLPLSDIHRIACRNVEPLALESAQAIQQLSTKLLNKEMDKIKKYYQKTVREIERKKSATTDPGKEERLEKQLVATLADWQRREEDIAGRYEVTVEVYLDHLVAYHVPCEYIQLEIQHKKQFLNHMLTYNWMSGKIEMPACPQCGKAGRLFMPDKNGQLFCSNCRAKSRA